jgi:CubicO group peptidase (beta-lactamase class C family)
MTAALPDRFAAACRSHGIVGAQLAWRSLAGGSGAVTFGLADRGSGRAVTQRTRFQIGSVTKTMLALCAHELARAGRADLDRPLANTGGSRWTRANPAFADITPRQLMTHTSGLEGDIFNETGTDAAAGLRLVEEFAPLPLLHSPGTDVSYCNFGFVMLGALIEFWSGKPWHVCVGEQIDRVAEGNALAFWPFPAPGDLAAGHGPHGVWSRTHLALSNAAAGTSAVGTAGDLALFGTALLALARTEDPVWHAMTAMPCAMARNERCIGFGQGLMVMDWGGTPVFGHDGLTIGQQAFLRIFPDTGMAYGLLANGGDMTGLHHAMAHILSSITGAAPPELLPEQTQGSSDLPESALFARRNASLAISASGGGDATLCVHHHEAWAREAYGSVEGPYPLTPAGGGSWLVTIPGAAQPRMLTISPTSAYYGMRRYNRVPDRGGAA